MKITSSIYIKREYNCIILNIYLKKKMKKYVKNILYLNYTYYI